MKLFLSLLGKKGSSLLFVARKPCPAFLLLSLSPLLQPQGSPRQSSSARLPYPRAFAQLPASEAHFRSGQLVLCTANISVVHGAQHTVGIQQMFTFMTLLFYPFCVQGHKDTEPKSPTAESVPSAPQTTHPWQGLLLVQGCLSFDGRVPGAVREEGTAWWEKQYLRWSQHHRHKDPKVVGSPGAGVDGDSHHGPGTPWSITQPWIGLRL